MGAALKIVYILTLSLRTDN